MTVFSEHSECGNHENGQPVGILVEEGQSHCQKHSVTEKRLPSPPSLNPTAAPSWLFSTGIQPKTHLTVLTAQCCTCEYSTNEIRKENKCRKQTGNYQNGTPTLHAILPSAYIKKITCSACKDHSPGMIWIVVRYQQLNYSVNWDLTAMLFITGTQRWQENNERKHSANINYVLLIMRSNLNRHNFLCPSPIPCYQPYFPKHVQESDFCLTRWLSSVS